jgi:polar amino acid transport system permease protein
MTTITETSSERVFRPAEPPRPWTGARITGHVLVGIWLALFAGLAVYLYNVWQIDLIETYGPRYWSGLKTTLILVSISIVLGALLSLPVALARMSDNRILGAIAYGYVYFFRGTPLLAQIFLIYYGLGTFRPFLETIGLWSFFREAWYCAVLAFTLNPPGFIVPWTNAL